MIPLNDVPWFWQQIRPFKHFPLNCFVPIISWFWVRIVEWWSHWFQPQKSARLIQRLFQPLGGLIFFFFWILAWWRTKNCCHLSLFCSFSSNWQATNSDHFPCKFLCCLGNSLPDDVNLIIWHLYDFFFFFFLEVYTVKNLFYWHKTN